MRDCAWVGEVVNTCLLVLGQENGGRQEIVENGVGVRNVDDTLVLCDFGDKVAGVEVITDWHTKSQNEAITVKFHDLLECKLLWNL